MLTPRTPVVRRLLSALDASPSRIPVLLGGCGGGRTTLLRQIHERLGRTSAQFVDIGRTATTPERFHRAVGVASPFPGLEAPVPGARAAFDSALTFFTEVHAANGGPATFLLDEFLELRTFESFPGLRRVLHEFIDRLAVSHNRFVLSSRYTARTLRVLRDRPNRFEVIHVPALSVEDTFDMLGPAAGAAVSPGHDAGDAADAEFQARTVQALGDGRASYVRCIIDELDAMREHGGGDALSALVSQLAIGGRLAQICEYSYELRLHRARGYGALKAILEILGDEEGLTLTEISQRLQRTPGSTKDYLSWLEDVDLVISRQKRYSFTDPLLRVWVRLHCRATAPSDDDVAREVHRYARPRLPQAEPALAMAAAGSGTPDDEKKAWGIIEID
jgi:hypothetical protein